MAKCHSLTMDSVSGRRGLESQQETEVSREFDRGTGDVYTVVGVRCFPGGEVEMV